MENRIQQLEARIEALEKRLNVKKEYTLPKGEYTQEEILKRFPELTLGTIHKHLPYPRVRRRVPMHQQPLTNPRTWVYIVT